MLDFEKVREILPQKYPFIMIDRVLELEPSQRIVAVKNITGNESIFLGHFPGQAVLPGAYIIESMAQGGILLWSEGRPVTGKRIFFLSSVKVRFLSPVVPGDQLIIELNIVKKIKNAGIVSAIARIDSRIAAKGELTFAVVEREGQ